MSLLDRLRRLDSCAVSDALDALGLKGATTGIRALWPAPGVVVGRARTIRVAPRDASMPGVHIATEVIETSVTDDVIVIDNRGSLDVSCWGGILTVAALAKGVTGVIIDGACRDIAESEEHGLPVFGRAVVPVSARGRIVQAAMDEPVRIDVALVRSEDFVIADRSGVVFVHPNEAERVITLAEKIAARETEMIAALRAGKSVVDVMHDSQFPSG